MMDTSEGNESIPVSQILPSLPDIEAAPNPLSPPKSSSSFTNTNTNTNTNKTITPQELINLSSFISSSLPTSTSSISGTPSMLFAAPLPAVPFLPSSSPTPPSSISSSLVASAIAPPFDSPEKKVNPSSSLPLSPPPPGTSPSFSSSSTNPTSNLLRSPVITSSNPLISPSTVASKPSSVSVPNHFPSSTPFTTTPGSSNSTSSANTPFTSPAPSPSSSSRQITSSPSPLSSPPSLSLAASSVPSQLHPTSANLAIALSAKASGHLDEEGNCTRCICGLNNISNGFMLCCETCEVWQHGDCVGISEKTVPEQYFCELCIPDHPIHKLNQIHRRMKEQKKLAAKQKQTLTKGKEKDKPLGGSGLSKSQSVTPKQKSPLLAATGLQSAGTASSERERLKEKERERVERDRINRERERSMGGERAERSTSTPGGSFVTLATAINPNSINSLSSSSSNLDNSTNKKKRPKKEEDTAPRLVDTNKRARIEEKEKEKPADRSAASEVSGSTTPGGKSGNDVGDSREQRKFDKLIETIKKIEDQSSKKKKRTEHTDVNTAAAGIDGREDVQISIGLMQDDNNENMDTSNSTTTLNNNNATANGNSSSLSSPFISSSARSARAKLRAEREDDNTPGYVPPDIDSNSTPYASLHLPSSSTQASQPSKSGNRKKKAGASNRSGEDDTVLYDWDDLQADLSKEVTDFSSRSRQWKYVRALTSLGPFYLGKKEFCLREWREAKEEKETGWKAAVLKEDSLPIIKRALINYQKEKQDKNTPSPTAPAVYPSPYSSSSSTTILFPSSTSTSAISTNSSSAPSPVWSVRERWLQPQQVNPSIPTYVWKEEMKEEEELPPKPKTSNSNPNQRLSSSGAPGTSTATNPNRNPSSASKDEKKFREKSSTPLRPMSQQQPKPTSNGKSIHTSSHSQISEGAKKSASSTSISSSFAQSPVSPSPSSLKHSLSQSHLSTRPESNGTIKHRQN